MRKFIALVSAAALVLSISAPVLAQSSPPGDDSSEDHTFRQLDTNRDGALSEAEAGPSIWPGIRDADTNHDGRVTRAELRAAHRSISHGRT